jgi:uncharacterized protein YcsI (UPF0317 family)
MRADMQQDSPSPDLHRQVADGRTVRQLCRTPAFTGHTSGTAPGFVQGNLVILPADDANDFLRFCQRNPKPCPVIGISEPGSPLIPELGEDLDIRTDLPRYRVWQDGELLDEPTSISHVWRDNLVAFVIGCSFTFEEALMADGIPLRHVDQGANVAMYRTSIQAAPAGRFHGPMVVSMRPMTPARAIRAVQITSRYPAVHGAPVHLGHAAGIGIADLGRPDYGDAVAIEDDELPVFWACGVTPQAVIAAARPRFAITHAPGCMLVTDRRNSEFAII